MARNEADGKHVEPYTWYPTRDGLTFLRVANDFKDPETKQQFYMIQEYRNNLIMAVGYSRGAARRYILEHCKVMGVE